MSAVPTSTDPLDPVSYAWQRTNERKTDQGSRTAPLHPGVPMLTQLQHSDRRLAQEAAHRARKPPKHITTWHSRIVSGQI